MSESVGFRRLGCRSGNSALGYDVSPDGERLLMLHARQRAPDVITSMTVVQNWTGELRRLIPTRYDTCAK
jgi:hypothetical protein